MSKLTPRGTPVPAEIGGAGLGATAQHLVAIDRLAALGSVTRGVVHEINNPLTTVLTNLNFVAESLADLSSANAELTPERLQELVEAVADVKNGAERVRGLVRDVHAMATDVPRTPLDVERVLGTVMRVAAHDLRQRGQLEVRLAGGLPEVDAEEGPLGQLFLALLLNAAQSIPAGATAANAIRVVTRLDEAARVVVEIHDTGVGVPEAVRALLFSPLVTTKPPGAGTGLGLHACRAIATAMGASLELLDAEPRGTVARLTMPSHARRRPSVAAPAKRGRVMVIDDDPTIGATVARVLRAHEVELLTSAREALAQLSQGKRPDVILCDLMMPDLTGIDLYEALARLAPDLLPRLVFLSGGAFTEAAAEFVARVPNTLLEKPFEPSELRAFVAARVGAA